MRLGEALRNFLSPQRRAQEMIISGSEVGSGAQSDVTINDEVATKVAAVKRCLQIKCGTVASLGLNLLKRQKASIDDRYYFEEDTSDLAWLLSHRPNDKMSAYDFLFNMIYLKEMTGNSYIYPLYEGGEIKQLILLSPNSVTEDKENLYLDVHDTVNNIYNSQCLRSDLIIIRNMSMDGGYTGISTLHFAANTIGISYKTDQQQKSMFTPGSMLRGFITGDSAVQQGFGRLQDKQLKDVSAQIRTAIRSGSWLNYLPGTMKYVPTGISAADMQLLESKKFTVAEICRFFDVPPEQVFQETSTNYKGSENSQTVFMTSTLIPMLRQIENEFEDKLIPRSMAKKYRVRFNLDNYYQSDITSKANYYQKMVQSGALTPNEVREQEGRAPIEGGDEVFISCNVAPITSAKIKGETQPAVQPNDPQADPNKSLDGKNQNTK